MTYIIHVSEYPFRGEPSRMYSFSGTFRQLLEKLNGIDAEGYDIVNGEICEVYSDAELIKFVKDADDDDGGHFHTIFCVEEDRVVLS
jgi:hypothetical protein